MYRQYYRFFCFFILVAGGCFNRHLLAVAPPSDSTVVVIDSVHLYGNEKTRPHIILRELAFKPGDTLTYETLTILRARAMRQIYNLALFTSVVIEIQKPDSLGHTEIDIYLKERWYLFVIPILEIADRNFNVWWETRDLKRLNYGVSITQFNLRGRNETMRINLQAGFTRKFSVDYFFPYINKKLTIGSNLNFTYSDNREVWYITRGNKLQFYRDANKILYQRVKAGIGFTYRKKIYTTHSLGFDYTALQIADTVASDGLNPNFFLNGNTRQLSIYSAYNFVFDMRDFRPYALNGKYLGIEAGNYLFITPSAPIFTLFVNAGLYKKLSARYYLNITANTKLSSPGRQPYNIYKAFGYDYFVRGFEYNVIDGQNFALGKINFLYNLLKQRQFHISTSRFKKFRNIPLAVYAKAFYDAGYVYDSHPALSNTYANSYLGGFGAGLDFITYYDRVFRFEYSFNNKGKSGLFLHYNISF